SAVVVKAITVEGQRRVSKQQDLVRPDFPLPDSVRDRLTSLRRGPYLPHPGAIPVDDVVILDERQSVTIADLVSNLHEHERAAPSLFLADVGDARDALDLVTDADRAI